MDDEAPIPKRINETLKNKSLDRRAFYRYAGIKSQSIRNWNLQGSMPAADTAIKMADYLKVSVIWLITGKEEPGLDQNERDILDAFKRLNDIGKKTALTIVRGLSADFPQQSELDGESSKTAT